MKFLHTADLHFGGIPEIGKVTSCGLRERPLDLIKALDKIIDIANKENVDTIFISGDVFHTSNPDSTSRKFWSNFITKLILNEIHTLKHIYMVVGNHDCPNNDIKSDALQVDSQYIYSMSGGPGIYTNIENKINFIIHPDNNGIVGIILIPYIENPELIREKIKEFYSKYENDVTSFIIVSHMEIREAEMGANDMKLKHGFSFEDEIFSHPKLIYAALGHIHKPQSFVNSTSNALI
jgi:exonuclease SbcD